MIYFKAFLETLIYLYIVTLHKIFKCFDQNSSWNHHVFITISWSNEGFTCRHKEGYNLVLGAMFSVVCYVVEYICYKPVDLGESRIKIDHQHISFSITRALPTLFRRLQVSKMCSLSTLSSWHNLHLTNFFSIFTTSVIKYDILWVNFHK